jgi:peptide/nickel transport system ATP-binding protein
MDTILEVKKLCKNFTSKQTCVRAVTDVDLKVKQGQTIGIVGESGCGKTTFARCIARAYKATSGEVTYYDKKGKAVDFLNLNKKEIKSYRRDIQMIFQDPYSSLDPRMTVFDIISEPILANYPHMKKEERENLVMEMAAKVGLNTSYLQRYPHAFSGGQRQRIGIARALILNPRIVLCDECVSALDVSIQAQIINLLKDLQKELNLTYLFISHDLSVVEYISDVTVVMYLGQVVESAPTEQLFNHPLHPYTEALLSSVPIADPFNKMDRIPLVGEIPNPANPPSGCRFHPRCKFCTEECKRDGLELVEMEEDHFVACYHAKEFVLGGIN